MRSSHYQMHHNQHTIYHQFSDLAHLSHCKTTSLHLDTPNATNTICHQLSDLRSYHHERPPACNKTYHTPPSEPRVLCTAGSPVCTDMYIIFRSNSELFNAVSLHAGPLLQTIDSQYQCPNPTHLKQTSVNFPWECIIIDLSMCIMLLVKL